MERERFVSKCRTSSAVKCKIKAKNALRKLFYISRIVLLDLVLLIWSGVAITKSPEMLDDLSKLIVRWMLVLMLVITDEQFLPLLFYLIKDWMIVRYLVEEWN